MSEYLGTFKIMPNTAEIEVDCYGTSYPAQRLTLEQEGFNAYCELEKVEHSGIDITDYIANELFNYLIDKVNEK